MLLRDRGQRDWRRASLVDPTLQGRLRIRRGPMIGVCSCSGLYGGNGYGARSSTRARGKAREGVGPRNGGRTSVYTFDVHAGIGNAHGFRGMGIQRRKAGRRRCA